MSAPEATVTLQYRVRLDFGISLEKKFAPTVRNKFINFCDCLAAKK